MLKLIHFLMVVLLLSACSSAKRFTNENDPSPKNPQPEKTKPEPTPAPEEPQRFYNIGEDAVEVYTGVASYYADKFHGRKTSSGETYNMYDLTAAHKTLPFNTILRVTNLANSKSVIVRVNDRGPFVEGREIDLSYGAAVKLRMLGTGTADVKIEVLELGEDK